MIIKKSVGRMHNFDLQEFWIHIMVTVHGPYGIANHQELDCLLNSPYVLKTKRMSCINGTLQG